MAKRKNDKSRDTEKTHLRLLKDNLNSLETIRFTSPTAKDKYFKTVNGTMKMDFKRVNNMVLVKYQRRHQLLAGGRSSPSSLSSESSHEDSDMKDLAALVEEHFEQQQVKEAEVIAKFLYRVANMDREWKLTL